MDKIKMIGFVLVFGIFWATALVAVDTITGPKIEKYLLEKKRKKVLEALVIPYEADTVEDVFTSNVTSEEISGKTIYRAEDGSIAFEFSGPGSQGPMSGIIALSPDKEALKGLAIILQSETPGLGSRVLAVDNLKKFRDKKVVPQLLVVAAGSASADNEVDAITGATLTSNALQKIINVNVQETKNLIGQ
ncbi:MAG: FMN-binding protein [Desulfofustis sp.]|jgi:Na+-transporting NADH:ubiquinone oxidoreductase subunit C